MARPEQLKSEARSAERVEFLGRACFAPHQLEGLGSAAISYRCKVRRDWRSFGDQPI